MLSRLYFPSFQKIIVGIILLLACNLQLSAQTKNKNLIPNAEKRKIIKAKKLYNDLRIYEGEKILKQLVKEHPYEVYYHEALVQMQRQVLRNIYVAKDQVEILKPTHLSDSTESEYQENSVNYIDTTVQIKQVITNDQDATAWNGLDRSSKKKEKVNQKEKEKQKEKEVDNDQPILQEAVMTIDSSILQNDSIETHEIFAKKDNALNKELKKISELANIPYDAYKEDLIANARIATRFLEEADSASTYLREFLVDTLNVDSNINTNAIEKYEEGIAEYDDGNIIEAIKLFKKALNIEPNYFSALLKLGDSYYKINKDTSAMRQYYTASILRPNRPEPFKRLAIAYSNQGNYTEAAAKIIEAIMVYPEPSYMQLLKQFVQKTGQDFNTQWIQREVYPITTLHVYEEIIVDDKSPWWHYQAAKQKVYSYFNAQGIVLPNDITRERYIEVYGWKKMLNNSSPSKFLFAREMDRLGFLDCYVLISLFHQDVYTQFTDLAKYQPEKIKKYFYLLINWDNKRLDKFKKQKGIDKLKPEQKNKSKK